MDQPVTVAVERKVATLTLNRPNSANSFSDEMLLACVEALERCAASSDVNVIVIIGAGRAFSSGGDLKAMEKKADATPAEMRDNVRAGPQRLARVIAAIDKPIIAALNGAATGGGLDLALMCDIRLATESARFAETYARVGLVPSPGGAYFLPRVVGVSRALDMFLTCEFVDARRALEIGLVDYVFPDAEFATQVKVYAEKIAAAAPISVRIIKRAVYNGLSQGLDAHLDQMASHLAVARSSADHREAIRALLEKRKPDFKDR